MQHTPHADLERVRLLRLGTIFACTVAAVLVLGGGRALANHVSCGDTISIDTTLDGDLIDCPNNGIVIGADDITIDLDGHRIDGDGAPAAGCDPEMEFCDIGVLNEGHHGVTVRGGSVREFDSGIIAGEARHNRLVRISSSRNRFFGILMFAGARGLIRDSSATRNIPPEGDGMGLFGCRHMRILDNSFRRNPGPGIHIEGSRRNLVKGNLFSRNGPGLLLEADRNRVQGNLFIRDGGIGVFGNRNRIARNRLSRGGGIGVERGHANLIARNVVVGADGIGIRFGLERPEQAGGGNNVVRRNVVRGSGRAGFLVSEKDDHSLLKRNVAIAAGGDGFHVISSLATLTGNRAARNADLGIQAKAGVTDGGGNKAHGNGDPRQCTGIVCG